MSVNTTSTSYFQNLQFASIIYEWFHLETSKPTLIFQFGSQKFFIHQCQGDQSDQSLPFQDMTTKGSIKGTFWVEKNVCLPKNWKWSTSIYLRWNLSIKFDTRFYLVALWMRRIWLELLMSSPMMIGFLFLFRGWAMKCLCHRDYLNSRKCNLILLSIVCCFTIILDYWMES